LATHLDWLLSQLEPHADTIREIIAKGTKLDLFCFSSGVTPNPPSIPRKIRERAKSLGITIEIDHYEER
jgi:hypothetical protein